MMDYLYTFLIGGIICVIGQILLDTTQLTVPRILVMMVVGGVILEGLQLYQPLINLAGTGASVPLPGFGYSLVSGAIEGARLGFLETVIGPLKNTAAGIGVAITFGYIVALIFSPKSIR